jgi:hypothetical protein
MGYIVRSLDRETEEERRVAGKLQVAGTMISPAFQMDIG